jgi:type I restriction-modification system DNA methylase subunit
MKKTGKHILENMLYMIEINPVNVELMENIFAGNKYNLNIVCGDALIDNIAQEILKKAGTDKFDLIMGNPQFQDTSDSMSGTIWNVFIIKYIKICYIL